MQSLFQRITIPVNQKMKRDAGAGLDILRRPVVYSRMTDPSLNSQVKRYRLRPTCTQIGDSETDKYSGKNMGEGDAGDRKSQEGLE